ncbi:N-acetylmuramoyl-L-alanine amidase [Holdemanella porci]|uniref:N-acetylmuramoyl-L-alanine amidase n=1 Tax=Holdemanella porci TaxID=2652276 RepID=UPI003FD84FF5
MSKRFKPVLALVLSLFMSVSTLSNTYTVFAEDETTVQTDEQTNEENSTETTEESEEETQSEVTATPTEDEKPGDSSMMEYFLVENPVLNSPATENFVLSMNDANGYSDFSITVQKMDETTFDLEASEQVDKLVKFTKDFSSADKGEYTVTTLHYTYNGEKYYLNFSDLGMDVKFGVDQEYSGYDETLPDMTQDVTEDDELGNAVIQVTNLNDASEEVADGIMASDPEAAMALIDEDSDIATQSNEGVTICLDPGHGGNDSGAVGVNNVYEKNLTLKIAQYCKQELEKYDCNVVMTRTGDTNPSLEDRANYAKSQGAQYLISIHLNSGSGYAVGAEVYYPNTNWRPDISQNGKNVAQAIQNQLVSIGIHNRGIKFRTIDTNEYPDPFRYDDGSVADYYGIIRNAKYNGLTGLIIEHCFINSVSDYNNYLNSDAKLQTLGVADANGIVSALGLSKKDAKTLITGATKTNVSQMVNYFINNGGTYDKFSKYGTQYDGVLAQKGAANIEEFCQIFYEEAIAENIRPEVAFCQTMKETGFLQFGHDVKPDQCNFAGLGATGNGVAGNSFASVREGIRAQIQHLKAYATTDNLINACVDNRFGYVKRGSAPYVEWLGKKENPTGDGWATGANYGTDIVARMKVLLNTQYVLLGSGEMYRVYNPNSGEHFYTSNKAEKDHLVNLGWKYEGVGWKAPTVSNYPVYRLYNANGGEHHYTMNAAEKNNLVKLGWKYEGIGWFSADPNDSNSVPLLREYNPNAFSNNHNYTTNSNEHNWLVGLGWKDEGKAWYATK